VEVLEVAQQTKGRDRADDLDARSLMIGNEPGFMSKEFSPDAGTDLGAFRKSPVRTRCDPRGERDMKNLYISLLLLMSAACTVTCTKTETWVYDDQGRLCGHTCTSSTSITANGTTAEGSVDFGIGSVKFKVGDKTSECTPKNPDAMGEAKKALEPCACDDDAVDAASDLLEEEVEQGEGEPGACNEPVESKTECSYEFKEADWDCKET
jgi:hypothetical protein